LRAPDVGPRPRFVAGRARFVIRSSP